MLLLKKREKESTYIFGILNILNILMRFFLKAAIFLISYYINETSYHPRDRHLCVDLCFQVCERAKRSLNACTFTEN